MKTLKLETPQAPDPSGEEFLRTTAHRLKTPVTSLGLALQRMEEVHTEAERREFFEMAKRGQRELSQAVEDVLETARNKRRRLR